jgi:hypothetical protein
MAFSGVVAEGCREAMKVTKPKLQWLILGISALVFLVVGERRAFLYSYDFVPVYTGAECLLHGCNPYDTSQLEMQFFQAGGRADELPSWEIDVPVYPPSTFLALSPLALLSYPHARLLWFVLNGMLFVSSVGLVVSMCSGPEQWLATTLGSVFLITSGILLVLGQPATLAISLVVLGSYLFLRGRLLLLGALLFVVSLAVKPQIGGLLVLYFLAQKIQWRYAAVAMGGALAFLLSAGLMLNLHAHSANWTSTLHANLVSTLSPGGSADPRPANFEAIGDINLQALTSIFSADAHRFNGIAYAIFLVLLACWLMAILRTDAGQEKHFLALGALSVLSLTPVYHRFYDTRLLVLTIPAAVIVFQKRRLLGALIAVVTVVAIVSVQYRVQGYVLQHPKWHGVLQSKLLFILLLRQQNLELLILFSLYLFAMLSIHFSSASKVEHCDAYQPAIALS